MFHSDNENNCYDAQVLIEEAHNNMLSFHTSNQQSHYWARPSLDDS
jgi:hypothetical protein